MDFGFEAGIGFFLALALCFSAYKIVMAIGRGVGKIVMAIGREVAHAIALSRRARRSRSLAQGMALTFARHRAHPLENYEWALSNVASLEQYQSALPPNEEASVTAAALVGQSKTVVAVCERALRIERIANLQGDIRRL
jgi:hypothetical protein